MNYQLEIEDFQALANQFNSMKEIYDFSFVDWRGHRIASIISDDKKAIIYSFDCGEHAYSYVYYLGEVHYVRIIFTQDMIPKVVGMRKKYLLKEKSSSIVEFIKLAELFNDYQNLNLSLDRFINMHPNLNSKLFVGDKGLVINSQECGIGKDKIVFDWYLTQQPFGSLYGRSGEMFCEYKGEVYPYKKFCEMQHFI